MRDEVRAGLCASCRHCQRVAGARSLFYLCARSVTDPRFQKYPPLPVVSCLGYESSSPPDATAEAKGSRFDGD